MPPFPSCRTASSCTSRARRDTINTVPAPWGASQPGAWLLLSHWHYTITQLEPELRRGSSSGHLCQALNTCFYSLFCLCENTGIKKNRNIMHIHHGKGTSQQMYSGEESWTAPRRRSVCVQDRWRRSCDGAPPHHRLCRLRRLFKLFGIGVYL